MIVLDASTLIHFLSGVENKRKFMDEGVTTAVITSGLAKKTKRKS
jgi:hypothetical protein